MSRSRGYHLDRAQRRVNIIKRHVPKPITPMSIQEARRQRTMELCIAFAHDEITRAELSVRLRSKA